MARERLADALRGHVRDCRPCRRRPSCRTSRSSARGRARRGPGTSRRARSRGSRRTAAPSGRARRSRRTARARPRRARRMPSSGCSAVCQPVVMSWRIWPSIAPSSSGVRYGSIIRTRRRAMLCSLRSSVRRVTSVGSAVNTGSTRMRSSSRSTSSASTPSRLQLLENVEEAIRLRRLRVAQVRAAPAQAMHLLGRVDHLEVRRERADEVARRARRERREQRLQFRVSARIALAARDRRAARGLDEVEQRLAALLANDLADELRRADARPRAAPDPSRRRRCWRERCVRWMTSRLAACAPGARPVRARIVAQRRRRRSCVSGWPGAPGELCGSLSALLASSLQCPAVTTRPTCTI